MIPPDAPSKIQKLSDAHKQTLQLVNRLAKLPAEPGSVPEFEDSRAELGAEIHDRLKQQQEDYELLAQEFEYQNSIPVWTGPGGSVSEKERKRADLAAQIARIGENLKTARSQFRKAQLAAKRSAEVARRKERELLFSNINEDEEGSTLSAQQRKRKDKEKENLTQDDIALNASNDVTAALKRTHALMQAEVQRSQFAHETLQQSTKQLESLSETYLDLDSLLSSSKSLVRTLIHSNKSDTWYLETAFWLLVVTISWLLFRRVLYGPTWWLVYLPIKTFWRLTFSIFTLLSSIWATLGATKQSAALSQVSGSISTSLKVQPSAKGGIPTFDRGMPARSVGVGGGGKGASPQQPGPGGDDDSHSDKKSLSDEVGEMAEGSRDGYEPAEQRPEEAGSGTVLRERASDEPRNPKKRMWEEPAAAAPRSAEAQEQIRDEL